MSFFVVLKLFTLIELNALHKILHFESSTTVI